MFVEAIGERLAGGFSAPPPHLILNKVKWVYSGIPRVSKIKTLQYLRKCSLDYYDYYGKACWFLVCK